MSSSIGDFDLSQVNSMNMKFFYREFTLNNAYSSIQKVFFFYREDVIMTIYWENFSKCQILRGEKLYFKFFYRGNQVLPSENLGGSPGMVIKFKFFYRENICEFTRFFGEDYLLLQGESRFFYRGNKVGFKFSHKGCGIHS